MSIFDSLFGDQTEKKQRAAIDKMSTAAIALTAREPFYSHIVYGLNWVPECPHRMAVDGINLFFDPDFVAETPGDELVGVLAHEACHVAWGHAERLKDRDPERWNIATDAVINDDLIHQGYSLPDDRIKFPVRPDETSEEVYDRLPKSAGGGGKGKPSDGTGGGFDKVLSPKVKENGKWRPATEREIEEIGRNVEKAAQMAQAEGKMPGNIRAKLDRKYEPQKEWTDELRKFLGGGELRERTWSRPNRRFIADGEYIPGNGKYGPGHVLLMVDSSGSINDATLAKSIAELRKINEDLQPECIHVVVCDAAVQWTGDFGPYDEVTAEPLGRGGTNFRPAFDYADKMGWPIRAAVYFTDLECSSYPRQPSYPVLWVQWPGTPGATPRQPPFGEVVKMR